MKFSRVLLFASVALAAPSVLVEKSEPVLHLEERQNDPVSTVVTSVNAVANTINTSVNAIQLLLNGITGNVGAEVQILIRANLDAILNALTTATTTIIQSTLGAAGDITAAASGLTQAQINNLAAALTGIQDAISQLRVIVTLTATDLTPDLYNLVQSQLTAIENAIKPFITPLATFANAVSKFNVRLGVYLYGLTNATRTLVNTVQGLLNGLGLGGLGNILTCILTGTLC